MTGICATVYVKKKRQKGIRNLSPRKCGTVLVYKQLIALQSLEVRTLSGFFVRLILDLD